MERNAQLEVLHLLVEQTRMVLSSIIAGLILFSHSHPHMDAQMKWPGCSM